MLDPCQVILRCLQSHGATQLEVLVSLAQITANVKEIVRQGAPGGGPDIRAHNQERYYQVPGARTRNLTRRNSLLKSKAALHYEHNEQRYTHLFFKKRFIT